MSQPKFFEVLETRRLMAGTALPAPTNLQAIVRSATAVDVFWTDNATSESGYLIDRSTNGTDFTRLNLLGANATSYTSGKLITGKKYYYRVRAFDDSIQSIDSNVVSVIPQSVSAPLPAPANFQAAASSATSIRLTWTDTASETGYRIERSTNGTTFTELNTVGPDITTYLNAKLITEKKYHYRVRAIDATRVSEYSAIVNATPKAPTNPPPVLNAPAALAGASRSSTSIKLTWTDTTVGETGFKIERSFDGVNFKTVNIVGPDVTSYINGRLTTDTKYHFRVRAYDAISGDGLYSNIASATPVVPPLPPLLEANELQTVALSSSSIRVVWKDNSINEKGYKLERSNSSSGGFSQIAVLAADTNYYNNSGLEADRKYYYRVRPFDDRGNGPYSNVVGRTTLSPGSQPDWASGGINDYATGNWFYDGVSVTLAADPLQVIPILKTLHVGSVRIWFNKNESWQPIGGDGMAHAKAYKEAGFRVMMVVGDDKIPTLEQSTAFFQYVANYKDALKYVDLWEIGNEPNIGGFWKGTAEEYVNLVLKPAYETFHPLGAMVVGAGATWDVNYAQKLVDFGYLNYVDYANFHPYGSTPEEVHARAVGARDVFAGKPILFSEWNIRNTSGRDAWAAKVDATRKLLATVGADSSFYFTFVVADTLAGPAGLINLIDLSASQPFYDMFKYWGEEHPLPVVP